MPASDPRPAVRASDAERERAVAVLRDATVDGRLTLEEFAERVERVQAAHTDLDLAALTRDLPAVAPHGDPAAPVRQRAICSRLVRRGPWALPQRQAVQSLFGTVELDLREATLSGPEVELDILNVFGTVTVIVPAGVAVDVTGGGWFASQVVEPSSAPVTAGAPVLRIRLAGPGGTLYVRARGR